MRILLRAITPVLFILCTRAILDAAPAAIKDQTGDNWATGASGDWDFGGTDVTFKAATGEIWVVDAHSSSFPFVNRFRATNMSGAPRPLAITLPAGSENAALLGIAEVPHGPFQGKNLILVDNTFGQDVDPQPLLGLMGDDGVALADPAFAPPVGLQPGARLSSIDVNPEREEIAAYDMTTHTAYILDFAFNVVQGPLPLLGFPCLFASAWSVDNKQVGSGVGLAYGGAEQLLVSSGYLNIGETRFVMEYDLAGAGAYTGRALDLSAAGQQTGRKPDVAFVGMDTGLAGAEPVLAALNFGNDALYLFNLEYSENPPPLGLSSCTVLPETSQYVLEWAPPGGVELDSIRIFENGAQVASLPPDATSYASELPVLGKVFVEVATEKGGAVSDLRPICQLENTRRPQLDGVTTSFTDANGMQRNTIYGVAVTKTPPTPEDFRAYIVAYDSNRITVLNHNLGLVENLVLTPSVSSQGSNIAAIGLALIRKDGALHLAVLDSDGPLDNNIPSGGLYALEGAERGKLVQGIPGFDLSALGQAPFLLDWDALEEPDGDGNYQFVAGGILSTGNYVLVRLAFDGTSMVGKEMAHMPHRLLSPFDDLPLTGVGVCFLPSGNILVAGSDAFSKTYTEALLLSPFNEFDAEKSPKLVGYAQGLVVSNEIINGMGPGIGPGVLYGFDAAYFPPAAGQFTGVGVTYLPTPRIILVRNGQGGTVGFDPSLFIHSENACSHPDLAAEQLTETTFDVAAGLEAQTGPLDTSFGPGRATDYFFYAINQSKTAGASIELKVRLGGTGVDELDQSLVLPPGRYFRGTVGQRAESTIEVVVKNTGQAAASIKVIVGAMAVGPFDAQPQFKRSDCNGDGTVQITDAIFGLNWLFLGGTPPECKDACDSDDNSATNLTDMIYILNYLFVSGPVAPDPGPLACGPDPSDDALEACVYAPDSCN